MLTLPAYAWARPRTVSALFERLAHDGEGALLVAGGTDLVPNLKHGLHEPRTVVSISAIDELRFVREEDDGLHLGALVTLAALARHELVRRDVPALAKAASLVASPQIRNMGTVGGNLCLDTRCTYYNQTHFWRESLGFCLKKDGTRCHVVPAGKRCVAAHSSDLAPMLIALDAEVEIARGGERRRLAVDDFFVADGIHNNVLAPGELVTQVIVPRAARGWACGYQKLRPRGAIDFPMLSVAFAARLVRGVATGARLVVSAIAAKPRLIRGVAALVEDRPLAVAAEALADAAHQQCHPLINVPYDADWRRAMVPVFVRRAVREAEGTAA